MKKNLKLILPLFVLAIFSCEENTPETYTGESIAYFSETSVTYPVEADSSFNVEVVVSESSTADRVFTVEIDSELTTATDDSYSMSADLSIAAGAYSGNVVINGVVSNVVAGSKLVLDLTSVEGSNVASFDNTVSITMNPSCPIVADFTGQYYIEELTAFVDGPTLNHEQIVTVSALAGNATQRTFDTANYISYCSTPNPFTFELNCGQVLMAGEGTQANCSCGGNLFFTNASTPSAYDPEDDSYFEVTFTNDAYSDCGAPAQTTYSFTKQ